jgi:ribosomal protein S24E
MTNKFVCSKTSTPHHISHRLGAQQVQSYIGIYESNEEAYEIEVTLF